MNNLNPDFTKSFKVSYHFEQHQKIKFEVLDEDDKNGKADKIGNAETLLENIMGATSAMKEIKL